MHALEPLADVVPAEHGKHTTAPAADA